LSSNLQRYSDYFVEGRRFVFNDTKVFFHHPAAMKPGLKLKYSCPSELNKELRLDVLVDPARKKIRVGNKLHFITMQVSCRQHHVARLQALCLMAPTRVPKPSMSWAKRPCPRGY
jgi:S-adenosylmethionine:tRNA-ribosyltransferase-isomerase (queuine synthetase)